MPGPQDPDPASERAAEDAVWRDIVENFGDRAKLDEDARADGDDPTEKTEKTGLRRPGEVPGSTRDLFRELAPQTSDAWEADHQEHYVPPPPPPVPRATPARTVAWIGLFGVPLLVLVAMVTHVSLPSGFGVILLVWFVGGFVYLVASMRPGPRDEDDDGAVV